eukprot:COSAG01_NODE_11162_length_1992_cov_1.972002_2_plen_100_part_00
MLRWRSGGVLYNATLIVIVAGSVVSRPFPSWDRSILTEIYLCHACSCQEIFRTETAGQVVSSSPVSTVGVIILAQVINGERAPATNLAPPRPAQLTPRN